MIENQFFEQKQDSSTFFHLLTPIFFLQRYFIKHIKGSKVQIKEKNKNVIITFGDSTQYGGANYI